MFLLSGPPAAPEPQQLVRAMHLEHGCFNIVGNERHKIAECVCMLIFGQLGDLESGPQVCLRMELIVQRAAGCVSEWTEEAS